MKNYYFVYELCLVLQNSNLNGFFHVVGSVNQVHVIHTGFSYSFTFEVNDLFISWL